MSLSLRVAEGLDTLETHRVDRSPQSRNLWFRRNQCAALAILPLAMPLFVLVAVLLWCSDGLPLIFAHYRVGRGGIVFKCFKFRTMRRNSDELLANLLANDGSARAEWARDQKLARDPRVTPVGKLLRKTSLDELPQLINVLRGEMALVGPRPITVAELSRYGASRWHYLSVLPGVTGLWQVSGRNDLTYDQRVALDHHYVTERSIWMDVSILFRTFAVALGRGAR